MPASLRLLLLLSLPLLLVACKEIAAEEPPFADKTGNLLGAWQLEHQVVTHYDEQGKVTSRRLEPRRPNSSGVQAVAFTDSTVQLEEFGLLKTTRYTRSSDTIRIKGISTWVIQRLTAKELVYQEEQRYYLAPPPAPFKRQETVYYFVR
ncbi:hypothetical protein [Hymenobacter pini]|uniref:hypothetical protein n=1 Tax=Hymenobacter pini TaxID=2880879 RepID=UPI001CF1251F|nr:hypothetical protein [Hymenobacter pini]MCA8830150.1 hypothetical protein [Hymenobacter pini]